MSISQVAGYINKIEKGLPIKLASLIAIVNETPALSDFDINGFQPVKVGAHTYVLAGVTADQLAILRRYVDNFGVDIVTGALQNNSHAFKVNGSMLLTQRYSSHPSVILFKDGEFTPPTKPAKKVLIVENRELFIHCDKTFAFLEAHCGLSLVELVQMDMILGSGLEIANSLHTSFLNECQEIYLCLDFDLGGLKIAKNLIDKLPNHIDITFLVPDDIEARLSSVIQPFDIKYLHRAYSYTTRLPPMLLPHLELIIKHQRVLEQEAYLYEI